MTTALKTLEFHDNTAAKGSYTCVIVSIPAILKSWKNSLFSFEWLNPDGSIKNIDSLPLVQREKRLEVELLLNDKNPLPKPVLGIGLMNTVEIGAGKAIFLTLAAHNHDSIPVHIPLSHENDFKEFLKT